MKLLFAAATVAASVALAAPQVAHAGETSRFTQGEAQAMLQTYPSTDRIFSRLPAGAEGLDIRPFQEFYGHVAYCVDDRHVLALAVSAGEYLGDGPPPIEPWVFDTRDEAWGYLKALQADFTLDGARVEVDTQTITQVARDGDPLLRTWGLQWGRILAPGELPVGAHTLRVTVQHDQSIDFDGQLSFTVSPSDSSACTA